MASTTNVMVTGATGFIGRRLVPRLLNAGYAVGILLREAYASGIAWPAPLAKQRDHFQVAYGDLRNYRQTSLAVRQLEPDLVIHLAAGGVTNPFLGLDTALRHNLYGTINLMRSCFEKATNASVQHLIIGRTPGELSAMNPYAASKAAAWTMCRMFAQTQQWPIMGAMIYQAYGPGQADHSLIPAAIAAALQGRDFPMTQGAQLRDWIFLDDVLEGIIATMEMAPDPGLTTDLGTGIGTSVLEVVESIYSIVGLGGRPLAGRLPQRSGEDMMQIANAKRTEELIGWRSSTTLSDGLKQIIQSSTD